MSLSILLDPQLAKPQKSHDFTIRFNEPIVLDKNKNYKAALNEVVTMSYSWYNVRAFYGNNTFRWKSKTESTWKTITLPDGMYNYDDLNSFIQKQIGKTKGNSAQLFTLFFDNSVFRAVILFFYTTLLKLIFLTELSRTCLDSRRKFWIKQRTFSKTFRTSPEESTGFTSIAISSQEKFKTWEVMCCFLCQLQLYQLVTSS